ncbi:hypothetical protein Zm00014a_041779 [Zea mays]|uniref:Uncharacterized protein n=1 Tax=Zea mays TaxID=4577 RepID=A0A3L6E633_MAIZE|nr:hypothetical protein Zm00014a_041779 [Zea mays]
MSSSTARTEKGQEHDRLAPYPRRRASVGSRLRLWTGAAGWVEEQGEGREDERNVRRGRKRWCAHDVKRHRGRAIATARVSVGAGVRRIRGGSSTPTPSAENGVARRVLHLCPRIRVPAILRLGSASTLPARSPWKGPPPADLAPTAPVHYTGEKFPSKYLGQTSSPRISLAIHGSGPTPDSARVKGQYSARAAQSAALVAYRYLSGSPKNRLDMSAVVQALEPLIDLDDDVPVAPLGHAGPVVLFVAAAAKEKNERAPRKDVLGHRRRPMSPKASPRKHPSVGTKEEFWVRHLPADQKTRPSLGGVVQAFCYYSEIRCRVSPPSVSGSCGSSSADPYGVPEFGWRDIRRYKQFRSVDTNISASNDSALGQRLNWHGLGSMPSAEAMRLFVKILEEEDPGWYSRAPEFNPESVVDIQMHCSFH